MAPRVEHELHKRRLGRNVGLGLVLLGFVAIVFALTLAKVQRGEPIEAYDHTPSRTLEPQAGDSN
ncbi:hypothetical protein ACFE33_03815 [Falsihalocynthiibacter sp. SS001]|uniref:hypothetical protein n=1 Tax=Falsihalocynthiibacter sp. SS001 TaxID=3349698 RepID=UPI0036D43D3B